MYIFCQKIIILFFNQKVIVLYNKNVQNSTICGKTLSELLIGVELTLDFTCGEVSGEFNPPPPRSDTTYHSVSSYII